MKVIFAKHDRCDKEFMFEVPKGMTPSKGDILWVDTCQGKTIATAVSDVFQIDREHYLVDKIGGAYLPLRKVKSYANEEIRNYIRRSVYSEIQSLVEDRAVLPF